MPDSPKMAHNLEDSGSYFDKFDKFQNMKRFYFTLLQFLISTSCVLCVFFDLQSVLVFCCLVLLFRYMLQKPIMSTFKFVAVSLTQKIVLELIESEEISHLFLILL